MEGIIFHYTNMSMGFLIGEEGVSNWIVGSENLKYSNIAETVGIFVF